MTRAPTVFVLTPDTEQPFGGVRQHYRLVDTLNGHGIDAAIVHRGRDFRCKWFEHTTPVVSAAATDVNERDIVVIPEEWVGLVHTLPPGVPKVIFNQNCYTTFQWGLDVGAVEAAYRHDDVLATVVVSLDSLHYLRHAFPDARVERVRCAIDPAVFFPSKARPVSASLSFMPRKRAVEANEVLTLLRLRGALDGWSITPIDALDETAVAETLRETGVFLSFAQHEGFGLPGAEAMASGCVVVGFHGFGGAELFGDRAIAVPDSDTLAFARAVEDLLSRWDRDRDQLVTMAEAASTFVHATYSPAAQALDAVPLFRELMGAPRPRHGSGRLVVPKLGRARWRGVAAHGKGAISAILGRER